MRFLCVGTLALLVGGCAVQVGAPPLPVAPSPAAPAEGPPVEHPLPDVEAEDAAERPAAIELAPPVAPLPVARRMEMRATAYCLRGNMRTGVRVREGMAAGDPAVLPLGSVVRVSHPDGRPVGIYVIMDTGSAVRGNRLDLWMASCADARQWGVRTVVAEVVPLGRR